MLTRRFVTGALRRNPIYFRGFSSVNAEDAGQRYREYRNIQNMDAALTKNIKSIKKKLTKDIEKAKLDQLSELIESRGFEIDTETCPKTLYLSKTAESGENIVISIWRERQIIEVHAMIEKEGIDNFTLTFRCACNRGLLGLYAVEVIPVSVGDDHTQLYGSRPMPHTNEELKTALMKYLNSFGIDSKIAQFSEIYCKQKENHQVWKFLKDFKAFAVAKGDQTLEGGQDGTEDDSIRNEKSNDIINEN